jgi:hypothetical protein
VSRLRAGGLPAPAGEGYVRADDQLGDGRYYRAWLDGVEIEDGCLEAKTGPDGWAVVAEGHPCACGRGECASVGRGAVRVEGRPIERGPVT